MRYIEFGSNNARVSEVILGTMRIAKMTPEQVAELIETAVESSINAVDTAPIYGPSEELIGKPLALSGKDAGNRGHHQARARARERDRLRLGDDTRGVVRGVPLRGQSSAIACHSKKQPVQ